MVYESQRIKIEGTNDADIAYALAHLAGFPKGTLVSRVNNIYEKVNSPKCVTVLHKEILDEVHGDVAEAMACRGPNIIVGQVYIYEKGEWKPSDEYLIEFDKKKVEGSLIGKIEEEIKLAYSER